MSYGWVCVATVRGTMSSLQTDFQHAYHAARALEPAAHAPLLR